VPLSFFIPATPSIIKTSFTPFSNRLFATVYFRNHSSGDNVRFYTFRIFLDSYFFYSFFVFKLNSANPLKKKFRSFKSNCNFVASVFGVHIDRIEVFYQFLLTMITGKKSFFISIFFQRFFINLYRFHKSQLFYGFAYAIEPSFAEMPTAFTRFL
jgi:hypothetical protein